MAGIGHWDRTKRWVHGVKHRVGAELKETGHKVFVMPTAWVKVQVRRTLRYGIWLHDNPIVDLNAMGLSILHGRISDDVIDAWFVQNHGVWYLMSENVHSMDLQNADRHQLTILCNYLNGLDLVGITYRENAPRSTPHTMVRPAAFFVAKSGYMQLPERPNGGPLAWMMLTAGPAGTRDYLEHLNIADKIDKEVVVQVLPRFILQITGGHGIDIGEVWGAATHLFARYIERNVYLQGYLERGYGCPAAHKNVITQAKPFAERLRRHYVDRQNIQPTPVEITSIVNAIRAIPASDRFGHELARIFNDLANQCDSEERLVLAAIVCVGALRYAKTVDIKSQKHMEHLSRVIQIFGAAAGFIPVPFIAGGISLLAVLADGLLHHVCQSRLDDFKGEIMRFAVEIDQNCQRLGYSGVFQGYLKAGMQAAGVLV